MTGRVDAAFEEVRAALERYLDSDVRELDWEVIEAEVRLAMAAHLEPGDRFSAAITFVAAGGVVELVLNHDGCVRLGP